MVFFDYEMALGVGGWGAMAHAPYPAELLSLLDHDEVARTVSDIRELPVAQLEAVITRIPDRYLASADKVDILEHLLSRRNLLPQTFGV